MRKMEFIKDEYFSILQVNRGKHADGFDRARAYRQQLFEAMIKCAQHLEKVEKIIVENDADIEDWESGAHQARIDEGFAHYKKTGEAIFLARGEKLPNQTEGK